MIFLMGDRYNPAKKIIKIVIDYYPTPEENLIKATETFRELYFEALRAP